MLAIEISLTSKIGVWLGDENRKGTFECCGHYKFYLFSLGGIDVILGIF